MEKSPVKTTRQKMAMVAILGLAVAITGALAMFYSLNATNPMDSAQQTQPTIQRL
jgi:hypothetical protein